MGVSTGTKWLSRRIEMKDSREISGSRGVNNTTETEAGNFVQQMSGLGPRGTKV